MKWRGKGLKWNESEEHLVRQAIKDGKEWRDSRHLFPGRSIHSIRNKFKWERYGGRHYAPKHIVLAFDPMKLLDERDLRANEPRTLTQILMGDPIPSRSALGRYGSPE